jgi:hypothetical protein
VALAAAFRLLGPSLFSLRLVSAIAGAAAVAVTGWLLRDVVGPRTALVAMLGLAASSWHVAVSRFAVNYVEPTLLTVPACLFWLRGVRRGRAGDFARSGLLAGAAQYASHTAKAVFLVLALAALDEAVRRWRARDRTGLSSLARGCVLAAAACLVVLAPLLRELERSPAAYAARMRQVSIFEDANAQAQYPFARLAGNVRAYLGAFNVRGDSNGRHHMPEAPLLDPVSAASLAAGFVIVLTGIGDGRLRFLLYWTLGGLAPGLMTVDPPTATRIVEAAPALYAIAAIGAVACWRRAAALGVSRAVRYGAAAGLAAAALAFNGWLYFVAMTRSPRVWVKLAPVATHLGRHVSALAAGGGLSAGSVLYAPQRFIDHPDELLVMRFFAPGLEVRSFEGPAFAPRNGDLLVLPNYRDLWRHEAEVAPGDEAEARAAGAELDRWRQRLGALVSTPVAVGVPFPHTPDPTFWLYALQPPRGPEDPSLPPT